MSSAHSFVYQVPLLPREKPSSPEPESPPLRDDLARLRASLSGPLAAKLSSAGELSRALRREQRTDPLPIALESIDRLLGGGLARGKMTELVGRRSRGRFSVAMSAIAAATTAGEAAAMVDLGDHLDPQAFAAAGVELARLLWIRPRKMKDAVAAAEMLVSTGFQLVVLDLGMPPVPGPKAPDAAWVRLARAAESHGTALLVSSPYPVSGTASEAVLTAAEARFVWHGSGAAPRLLMGIESKVMIEKHRHQRAGRSAALRFSMREAIRK